jgi:cell wall-associated NlpC family hydrolase
MSLLITDIKLPAREVTTILSYLESNNMPARIPDRDRGLFNCWGFTAWYLQWEDKAKWLEGAMMEFYLAERTTPISKSHAKAGDIVVFRSGRYLTHTAVLLPGGDVVCHKPGANHLCIDTVEAASISYGSVTYARVIKKEKKEFDNSPECVTVEA